VGAPGLSPAPGRSARLDNLPENVPPQIAARARELLPLHQAALADYLEGTVAIPGGREGKLFQRLLRDVIAGQARGRALTQAQAEVGRGAPLRLGPGQPARLAIDQGVDFPFGFYNRADFDVFAGHLRSALPDVQADLILTGSSVTGRRYQRIGVMGYTEGPFNVGRISHGGLSDFDVGIVSADLYARAVDLQTQAAALNVPASDLRVRVNNGVTDVLTLPQIRALGLEDMYVQAQRAAVDATGIPHEVTIAIYRPGSLDPARPHFQLGGRGGATGAAGAPVGAGTSPGGATPPTGGGTP
jgi:hypothetical protein